MHLKQNAIVPHQREEKIKVKSSGLEYINIFLRNKDLVQFYPWPRLGTRGSFTYVLCTTILKINDTINITVIKIFYR